MNRLNECISFLLGALGVLNIILINAMGVLGRNEHTMLAFCISGFLAIFGIIVSRTIPEGGLANTAFFFNGAIIVGIFFIFTLY